MFSFAQIEFEHPVPSCGVGVTSGHTVSYREDEICKQIEFFCLPTVLLSIPLKILPSEIVLGFISSSNPQWLLSLSWFLIWQLWNIFLRSDVSPLNKQVYGGTSKLSSKHIISSAKRKSNHQRLIMQRQDQST